MLSLGGKMRKGDQVCSLKLPNGLSWRGANILIQMMTEGWKFPEGVFCLVQ